MAEAAEGLGVELVALAEDGPEEATAAEAAAKGSEAAAKAPVKGALAVAVTVEVAVRMVVEETAAAVMVVD